MAKEGSYLGAGRRGGVLHYSAYEILAPGPGVEPCTVRLWSPNHWTTREFSKGGSFYTL